MWATWLRDEVLNEEILYTLREAPVRVESPVAAVTRLSYLPRGGLRLIHQLLNRQVERIQIEVSALLFDFVINPDAHCVQVYVYRSHF